MFPVSHSAKRRGTQGSRARCLGNRGYKYSLIIEIWSEQYVLSLFHSLAAKVLEFRWYNVKVYRQNTSIQEQSENPSLQNPRERPGGVNIYLPDPNFSHPWLHWSQESSPIRETLLFCIKLLFIVTPARGKASFFTEFQTFGLPETICFSSSTVPLTLAWNSGMLALHDFPP